MAEEEEQPKRDAGRGRTTQGRDGLARRIVFGAEGEDKREREREDRGEREERRERGGEALLAKSQHSRHPGKSALTSKKRNRRPGADKKSNGHLGRRVGWRLRGLWTVYSVPNQEIPTGTPASEKTLFAQTSAVKMAANEAE